MVLLGNGSKANVDLKCPKENGSDWLLTPLGIGAGVMIPAMMFGAISGEVRAHEKR